MAASLRQRAEAHFREREDLSQEKIAALSHEEMGTILHELRVHQIELEMQNENLRRAQADLDAARAHYFDLYDLAPVGYVTISEPGIILEANLTAATLLGIERGALVKQPVSHFIFQEDHDSFYLLINEPHETGWPTCDLRMVKSDGTTFWAHVKIVSVHDENGAPQRRIVFSDITWRKLADEKIRSLNADLSESEDRLHELNALGELLMLPNPIEKKFQLVTDTVVRVFGADFARIWIIKPGDRCNTGCPHAQVTEGPHMCRFRDKCLHLLASSGRYTHTDGGAHARVPFGCYKIGKIATGEDASFLTNEVTTDPRVHDHAWAQELGLTAFAGYCLIDAASTPVGVLALFSRQAISKNQDLLLRGFAHLAALTLIASRAEELQRKQETHLEAILEAAADGILAVDTNGKVMRASRRFAEIWKIPESLMKSGDDKALLDFVMTQLSEPEAFLKKVQALYDSDEESFDVIKFKDGRIAERYSFAMIMGGVHIGRVWSFRDVTERKRAEENLRKKNAEIERFTYMVSHDLKSPLVTIKTFLGYLEEDFKTNKAESAAKDLGFIHGAADKMELLLNDLLEFARIGHLKVEPVRMPLQEVVEEALNLVAGQIAGRGVQVEATKEPVWLHGDRSRLVQIYQNLVDNAVKFLGDQPDPRIEIGSEQEGGETVLFVRDNGKGIDPRHQQKLFGLFEKLDPGTPGSGVGLATVRRIVEAHGGEIEAHSDGPGKGATFRFTLAKTERNPTS
jgi:PAS domain S-box-containing protein